MIRIRRAIVDSLHIAALSVLALGQPLFDLLSRNAEFFAVRQHTSADIVALALTLALAPGILYLPIAMTLQRLLPRHYGHLHAIAVGLVVFLLFLPAMHRGVGLAPWPSVGLSLGAAILFLTFYRQHVAGRRFLHLLTPAILLLPGLFLFHSPINQFLTPRQPPQVAGAQISADTPIVFIVFDELPLSSLLRRDGTIDAALFPGFAALAGQSTWYRNAHSVAEYTTQALPALLTGRYPVHDTHRPTLARDLDEWLGTPTAHDHPRSLFTALGDHYDMKVFESVTSLCPETLCTRSRHALSPFKDRMALLSRDLAMVYAHVILPEAWAEGLPPVDLGWADFAFAQRDELREDDAAIFQAFIESLVPGERPALYFHHSTLPHNPWTYLPSGRRYGSVATGAVNAKKRWSSPVQSRLAYQQHLLQARYADLLLGQAIGQLKTRNLFERAMIIVTADHGASFQTGAAFRELEPGNELDIVNVPLFIKYPEQTQPMISDRRAGSVDLMPTILRALDSEPPWAVDGSALQASDPRESRAIVVYDKRGNTKQTQLPNREDDSSVADKVRLFGEGNALGLFGHPHTDLIDQPATGLTRTEPAAGSAEIASLDEILSPRSQRNWLPALVKGRIRTDDCDTGCPLLALAVNDHIAAVLHPQREDEESFDFAAVVSDTHLRGDRNHLSLYRIDSCGSHRCLRPMQLVPADE